MGIQVRRRAQAQWQGPVDSGGGHIRLGSGALDADYSLNSRTSDDGGSATNPEELIGAGLAGCFAMSVANLLENAGHDGIDVRASAAVHLDETNSGFSLSKIALTVSGGASDVDRDTITKVATEAKDTCPVSQALAGTEITLTVAEK